MCLLHANYLSTHQLSMMKNNIRVRWINFSIILYVFFQNKKNFFLLRDIFSFFEGRNAKKIFNFPFHLPTSKKHILKVTDLCGKCAFALISTYRHEFMNY